MQPEAALESLSRPLSLLTMRWSLTPPFHHFLDSSFEEIGMCIFCDTIRSCRISPTGPPLVPLTRIREAPCPAVFGLSSPSRIREIERLPDAPASASGHFVQPSQQKFLLEVVPLSLCYFSSNLFFVSIPWFARRSASRFFSRGTCLMAN